MDGYVFVKYNGYIYRKCCYEGWEEFIVNVYLLLGDYDYSIGSFYMFVMLVFIKW